MCVGIVRKKRSTVTLRVIADNSKKKKLIRMDIILFWLNVKYPAL